MLPWEAAGVRFQCVAPGVRQPEAAAGEGQKSWDMEPIPSSAWWEWAHGPLGFGAHLSPAQAQRLAQEPEKPCTVPW